MKPAARTLMSGPISIVEGRPARNDRCLRSPGRVPLTLESFGPWEGSSVSGHLSHLMTTSKTLTSKAFGPLVVGWLLRPEPLRDLTIESWASHDLGCLQPEPSS